MTASGHTDPDIQATWDAAREALADLIRPWVVDHKADELAKQYVDGHLNARGWKPPLRRLPDPIAQARALSAQEPE